MEGSPQFIETYIDPEVQQDASQFDLPESYERNLRFERGIKEGTFGVAAIDQAIKFGLNRSGERLDPEQLNQEFKIEGLVEFDSSMTRAAAMDKRDKAIESAARKFLIEQEASDNNIVDNIGSFGSEIAGYLIDPVNLVTLGGGAAVLKGTAAGAKSFLIGSRALKGSKGAQAAIAFLEGSTEFLANPAALGSINRTRIAAGAGEVALQTAITEPLVFKNARDNNYDYDVTTMLLMSGAGVGVGGLLGFVGARAVGKQMDKVSGFLDNMILTGRVSEKTIDALYHKTFADALDNRVPSVEYFRAAQKVDYDSVGLQKFHNDLDNGRFSRIIPEDQMDYLKKNIAAEEIPGYRFASWVSDEADPFGRSLRAVGDSDEIFNRLGIKKKTIGALDNFLKGASGTIDDVSKQVNLLQKQIDDLSQSKVKGREQKILKKTAEKDKLLKQLENSTVLADEADNLKRFLVSDELQNVYDEAANIRKVDDMSFDEFKSEFKDLVKSLKSKKLADNSKFISARRDTKLQVARMYHLANPLDEFELPLKNIYDLADGDLEQAWLRHKYESELGTLSYKDALGTLKQHVLDPDIVNNQRIAENFSKVESDKLYHPDVLDAKIEADVIKEKLKTIDDPELQKAVNRIDDEIANDTDISSGLEELVNCVLGAYSVL